MFIELTDHLRCPADHPEQFLVLLPGSIVERSVRSGDLGCPVCGRAFHVVDGVLDFGGSPRSDPLPTMLTPEAIAAFAGLNGPGGYAVLVGGVASHHAELAAHMSGVGLVAVNPPAEVEDAGPGLSVLRSARLPLKRASMRAVVLGAGFADDPAWVHEAERVILPGLRIVGEGAAPSEPDLELLASTEQCWVGTLVRGRM